jgi:PAS domain S-box-containing protein
VAAPRKMIPAGRDGETAASTSHGRHGGRTRRKARRSERGSQEQLALLYSVAGILAAADSVADAMPRVLEAVCGRLDWDAGAYWAVDAAGGILRCGAFRQRPGRDLERFRSISREITFAPGVGLPGRVWASGSPALIRDMTQDADFPRAAPAAADGLRGAVCFPVMSGAGFLGAIECFSHAPGELDKDLVRALTALGALIGQFVERTRAEAARRETEARRASMLETALDAVITIDHEGRVVEFNPAAERTFGYSREGTIGRDLTDLIIPPEQRAQHRAGLARYLATGEGPLIGRRLEMVALRADGSRFPAEVAITRVPLDGPPLFTGYIRDLSERRRIEAALGASEERLRTIVAHAPVVLFAVDRDGIFTLSEGAGLTALGIRPDEHVGQSYFTLYGHLADSVAAMRRALTGEHTMTVNRFQELVFETRWMPLPDTDGGVKGVIGVSTDITERSRIEEERLQLEQRTRTALDALLAMAEVMARTSDTGEDALSSVRDVARRLADLAHTLLGCRSVCIIALGEDHAPSPLACAGLSPDQAAQWHKRIDNWPRGTALFKALMVRLEAGEPIRVDTAQPEQREMANPFGIERYLLVPMRVGTTLVGLFSVDYGPDHTPGSPGDTALVEGVAGLAALVLERERLQREREEARGSALALREANRRMEEFLGIAGHEMRTPLTSIKVSLQLAQRRIARLHEHEEARTGVAAQGLIDVGSLLDRAATQMRRIERLVDDMVDVSRIGAGRMEIRRQRCDLAAIVRDSVDEQRSSAPDRRILLTGVATALPINADPDRLGQVVTNYLTNALKYAYAERPIQVGLTSDGVAARVWVRDEGPGLTTEERERVWEVFYRAAGVAHRHGSSVGLGMGLHICRTIVEQHGGRTGVESVPSVGATFWFTLPLTS